jgi:hypothetical protein
LDARRLNWKTPLAEQLLNTIMMGLDAFMCAVYLARLFWPSGETDHLSASLGNLCIT